MHPVLNFLIRVHVRQDGCWEWLGGKDEKGYGRSKLWLDKPARAHRIMWELVTGMQPEKRQELLHSCDNRWCVNPQHLSAGTHAENMQQMVERGRSARGETNNSKLTEAQVLEIRDNPASTRKIALEHGVAHSVIWRIKAGQKWKYASKAT
jgi:hypothetical protein